jgi:hypothetical protein
MAENGEFVPTQKIVGMQVIDSKGSSVPWEDIQSIVDVVLLRKEVEVPKVAEAAQPRVPPPGSSHCASCGAPVISTARFCPKCGTKLK